MEKFLEGIYSSLALSDKISALPELVWRRPWEPTVMDKLGPRPRWLLPSVEPGSRIGGGIYK